MAKKQDNAPNMTPPLQTQEENFAGMGGSQPMSFENEGVQSQENSAFSAPNAEILSGLRSSESADTGYGAGVWSNGKKVSALWSINENRNAWAAVTDLGWKKLATDSDSAIVALNLLTSHARDRDRSVNVRVDNNIIVEIYVW